MDLVGYRLTRDYSINTYITENYGDIPRLRGVRFLKVEKPLSDVNTEQESKFNKYVGQDVILIHTRCGHGGFGFDDEDSNYIGYGAKEWEEKYKDLFLEHVIDNFDSTYCDHYFKAVKNKEYFEILKELGCLDE